jgi:ubiquinone/menaquinone biosynthesis C-methylase UbiE
MAKSEFDAEFLRLVEEFNTSAGAIERRSRILADLDLRPGNHVLDIGSGPGHMVAEIAPHVRPGGSVKGVDSAESAVTFAQQRWASFDNVEFVPGDAYRLPFENSSFDVITSSQVFEYLDNVTAALSEVFRVLKPGGRVLIHGTDWGALLWRSSDAERMRRFMDLWDGHLADPHMPQTLTKKLATGGFKTIKAEPVVHVETSYDQSSMSAILIKFVIGYVVSQGVAQREADAWGDELRGLGATGDYFFSSNEYIFTATR